MELVSANRKIESALNSSKLIPSKFCQTEYSSSIDKPWLVQAYHHIYLILELYHRHLKIE